MSDDCLGSFKNGAKIVDPKDAGDLPKPSRSQLAEFDKAKERQKGRRAPLPMTVKSDGKNKISISQTTNDSDLYALRLMDACGTMDANWLNETLIGLQSAGIVSMGSERAVNAGLAFLNGLGPKDELEAALGVQMYNTHVMMVRMAQRAERQEHFDAIAVMYGQYSKLARTFTAQVEALAKLRGGGKQVVEVSHTHIDARNSQNVIAEQVTTGGGGRKGNPGQPHAQGVEYQPGAPVATVWSEDTVGEPVPIPGSERKG